MRLADAATILALAATLPAGAADRRVVAYEIVNAREITESLTGVAGDPEAGRRLYFDRALTRCSGCHGSPGGPGAQADPDAAGAPPLAGIGSRMSAGEIRLWLVAPQVPAPGTAMPSYYAAGRRTDPTDPRFGEPLLTAAQIEDLVAYLARQTG